MLAEAIREPQADDEYEVELFGTKEARYYQIYARNMVAYYLRQGVKRICVEGPTGAGKTLTGGLIFSCPEIQEILGVKDRKMNVLFLSHKHRLLTQAERAYVDANNANFIFHSVFSEIPQEVYDNGIDLICLDECHHEAMSTFQIMLEMIGDFPIIGLTATTDRPDGLMIKFEKIIVSITREEAVRQGFLAPTKIHSFVDTSATFKADFVNEIISQFGHEMGQTMIFMKTKREVEIVHNHLIQLGYNSVGIVNQNESQLNFILDQFSAGVIQFIVNCNRINEGVDVVGCTDVLLGRQFGSYVQLNQVIGRAARPDSDCNVWELINPLSGRNLDTTVIVGTPESHRLISKKRTGWIQRDFDYVTQTRGIESSIRIVH